MIRYVFVAGLYAATVLAAPAPAQDVAVTPAGWRDDDPSLGSGMFGWSKPNYNKPATAVPEAGPSTLFIPSAGSRNWDSLYGGGRGDKSSKSGSGAGAGSSLAAPPSSAPAPAREWGSLFGGGGRSGSDPSALSWGSGGGGSYKPKPDTFSGSRGSGWSRPGSSSGSSWRPQSSKPKPEWTPNTPAGEAWPSTPEPKPAAESAPKSVPEVAPKPAPEIAAPVPSVTEPKPNTAIPAPEPAQPKPAVAGPKPDAALSSPEAAKPETAAEAIPQPKPEPAQPAPEVAVPAPVAKPEPKPVPNPEPEHAAAEAEVDSQDKFACGPKKMRTVAGDIETIRRGLWQPKIGAKWQIILDGVPDTQGPMEPADASIWDIDAWDAKASDICEAKKKGKKVICYFSAGTSESWREDNHLIAPYNIGNICADTEVKPGAICKNFWKGEKWIDIRNPIAWDVMKGRIKMAAEKGCDGVDPDNMDIYDNEVLSTNATYGPLGHNVKFSENDSVKYLKFMADEAAKYGMSIGLKNSLTIVPKVKSFVQFAVNEECAKIKECSEYRELLAVKKPIFHIEYTGGHGNNAAVTKTTYKDAVGATKKYCNPLREAVSQFSTIIKAGETLGNQYLYCDGKPAGFTKMAFYVDKGKKGKGRGNFLNVEKGDGEEEVMDFEANEKYYNTTRVVKRRAPIKRRHHRWAELERNPAWVE